MTISTKSTIKTYFETGDFPTQSNFSDFIDSCIFGAETSAQSISSLNITTILSANAVNAVTVSALTVASSTITTALIFPTNIQGTSTNNNASAGSVGEFISSTISSASAIGVSSGISTNVTTISLTAGDWDVSGMIGTAAQAGTTTSLIEAWTGVTSASPPADAVGGGSYIQSQIAFAANSSQNIPIGTQRLSLSGTTTVYLSCNITFAAGTMKAYGFLGARRVR